MKDVAEDPFIISTICHLIIASLVAQLVKNPPAMQETPVYFLGQEDQLEMGEATHSSTLGLPGDSDDKESACNAGDLDCIPGFWRSPGEGNAYSIQYSGLENSLERGAWQSTVHGGLKELATSG